MSVRKRPDGTYRVRWREYPGAPEKSRHFSRKLDADTFETQIRHTKLTGSYIDPSAGKVLMDAYALQWAASRPWRPSTRDRMTSILKTHVVATFGKRELRSILPSDVQSWVGSMSANDLAPATVEGNYRVLAALMRSAVLDRLISESPCRSIRLPRRSVSTGALTPLTTLQVRAVAAAMPERLSALVLVSAGLGLRQGEACGLTMDRVDFLRRKVTIDQQLTNSAGVPPHLAPPKTPASVRSIALPDSVGAVLAEHIRVFGSGDLGLLFTTPGGGPLRRGRWAREFAKATGVVGVVATSHDLRHHAASLLIASGCSVKAVQHFLGHATAAETLDTYGHLWPDDEDRIRASIDAAMATASLVLSVAR